MKLRKKPTKADLEKRNEALLREAAFQRKRAEKMEQMALDAMFETSRAVDSILVEIVRKYGPIEIPIPDTSDSARPLVERDSEACVYRINIMTPEPEDEDEE